MENTKFSHVKLVPRSIWALGFVALFMDTSSELIHSLLPVFMVSTLGASMTSVGIVEGFAEATALMVKIFSGTLSDYMKNRKVLTLIGYSMAALSKPLFPLATSINMVFTARFVDRIGKGVRGAPRDALIGDLAPPEIRGASFGLRQALDTVGAFLGPLLAMLGMLIFADDIRLVFWMALIPALISVAILIWGVKEPRTHTPHFNGHPKPVHIKNLRHVGSAYWHLVGIAGVLNLARFSGAFLILKSQSVGLSLALIPLVMVLMNMIYALAAYPAGRLSDRIDREKVILGGVFFLIMGDMILGLSNNFWGLVLGISFWGLHLALTEGLFAAMVTDSSPHELRGTAYGVFNFVCGIAILISSIIAGLFWDTFGPSATFLVGAFFTSLAFLWLLVIRINHKNGD